MKDRPILFTPEHIRKIQNGQKRQTRRIMKPQPDTTPVALIDRNGDPFLDDRGRWVWSTGMKEYPFRYGTVGSKVWVREACAIGNTDDADLAVDYFADGKRIVYEPITPEQLKAVDCYINDNRTSPLHMPRWAARIWLEVTAIRIEQLQDISVSDMRAEGVRPTTEASLLWRETLTQNWIDLWDQINGKEHPWKSNPFVWVIDFTLL